MRRKKVDQGKELILLAKKLVQQDEEKASNSTIGDKINKENDLEQIVIAKAGPVKDLSAQGQFIVGHFVGAHIHNIEKGLSKSHSVNIMACIDDKFEDKMKATGDKANDFVASVMGKPPTIEKEAIQGQKSFDENISQVKEEADIAKVFKADLPNVNKYIEAVRDTVVALSKNLHETMKDYVNCVDIAKGKKSEERQQTWENVLDVKIDFAKTYDCKSDPSKWLLVMAREIYIVPLIKDAWEFIKNGFIMKRSDKINWYKLGKAVGAASQHIIKPTCKEGLKTAAMKRWKNRYFNRK